MSLRSRGSAALTRRQGQANAVTITYTRGAESVTIAADEPGAAWVGNTLFARVVDEPGAAVLWGERDYIIPAASLVIGGELTRPQKGDRIAETIDGAELVFELQTPTGEPAWRYSDADRQRYRVHMKKVSG